MYDLRTHSLRKYFKTQLLALGVQSDYIDYMRGHTVDTYDDIPSLGVEKLRSVYAAANFHKTKNPTKQSRRNQRNHPRMGHEPRKHTSQRCTRRRNNNNAQPRRPRKSRTRSTQKPAKTLNTRGGNSIVTQAPPRKLSAASPFLLIWKLLTRENRPLPPRQQRKLWSTC